MGKMWAIVNALYQGRSLANPAAWKNVQIGTNALLVVLGLIPAFLPELGWTDLQMERIAQAIMIIGGSVVNAYFTVATSDKVGMAKKAK